MLNLYITDLNVIKLYCFYLYDLILYKGTKGMASKKKKAEIKKKKPWSTSIGCKGKMFGGV